MDDELRPEGTATASPSRTGIGMLVVALLLLVAAGVFVILGLQADSAASDDRDRATHLRARQAELTGEQRSADRDAVQIDVQTSNARSQLNSTYSAISGFSDVGNQFLRSYSHGRDLHNAGDVAGGAAVWSNETAAAVAGMDEQNSAVQQALTSAEAAVQKLEATIG